MKCPNCNVEMEKGICLKCGYMENGNTIEQFKDSNQHTEVRLYNEDFDQMNTNETKLLNFIMGSYYFSYRGHFIMGLISSIIALTILFFELKLTRALSQFGSATLIITFLNTIFYITINRVIYMSFSNPICIEIDKCKAKKIKNTEKLVNHKCRNCIYLLIHLLITLIPIIFIINNA